MSVASRAKAAKRAEETGNNYRGEKMPDRMVNVYNSKDGGPLRIWNGEGQKANVKRAEKLRLKAVRKELNEITV